MNQPTRFPNISVFWVLNLLSVNVSGRNREEKMSFQIQPAECGHILREEEEEAEEEMKEVEEEEDVGWWRSRTGQHGEAPVRWPEPSWCLITASGQPPPFTAS